MKTQEELKTEQKTIIVWFLLELVVLFAIGSLFVIYIGEIDIKTFLLAAVFRIVTLFFKSGIKRFLKK
jgi:hypothetical protein